MNSKNIVFYDGSLFIQNSISFCDLMTLRFKVSKRQLKFNLEIKGFHFKLLVKLLPGMKSLFIQHSIIFCDLSALRFKVNLRPT